MKYIVLKRPVIIDSKNFGSDIWQPAHVGELPKELADEFALKLKKQGFTTKINPVEESVTTTA